MGTGDKTSNGDHPSKIGTSSYTVTVSTYVIYLPNMPILRNLDQMHLWKLDRKNKHSRYFSQHPFLPSCVVFLSSSSRLPLFVLSRIETSSFCRATGHFVGDLLVFPKANGLISVLQTKASTTVGGILSRSFISEKDS